MSYWRKKSEVGKERPNGIWHPVRMQSVNINRQSAKRFNIVFIDGKIGQEQTAILRMSCEENGAIDVLPILCSLVSPFSLSP
jgi:hypothetical protein